MNLYLVNYNTFYYLYVCIKLSSQTYKYSICNHIFNRIQNLSRKRLNLIVTSVDVITTRFVEVEWYFVLLLNKQEWMAYWVSIVVQVERGNGLINCFMCNSGEI